MSAPRPDLDTIRERIAEHHREFVKRVNTAAQRRRAPRRRGPHSRLTRERLRDATFAQYRAAALADPNTHPLRRARLEYRGKGLTTGELAARAMVGRATVQRAEAGRPVQDLTLQRLGRALGVAPSKLRG